MALNTSNLAATLQSLASHLTAVGAKDASHQAAIDSITTLAGNLDNSLVAIIQAPDPGPRTDLDFAALDAAVLAFKENTKISQSDANNVAGLIGLNTPK